MLAGIHVSGDKVGALNTLINAEKVKCFGKGNDNVEIKSSWLRRPEDRRKQYLDKYNVSAERLREFIEDFWYSLFSPENFLIQAFVLDKRFYKQREKSPLALLSQIVFDRLVMYPVEHCIVVFDQMESSVQTRQGDHGLILNISNDPVNTSPYFDTYSHSDILFEKSSISNFLQLADTVAYNVWRQFFSYGDQWEYRSVEEMDKYEYLERILPCFYRGRMGDIGGFGIVKIPNTQ